MKSPFKDSDVQFIIDNYAILGSKECSKFINFTPTQIRCKAWNLGIKKEHRAVHADNFSSKINRYSSYILGFIWADGYVCKTDYSVKLCIKTKDAINIKPYIFQTGNWFIINRYKYDQLSFQTKNKELHKFLSNNDYQIKSSVEPTKILSIIPENLKHYFWLGFIDGDGCWSYIDDKYLTFSISGPKNYKWIEFQKLLNNLNINKFTIRTKEKVINNKITGSSEVGIYNKGDITKLGQYLYSDKNLIGLNRKFDKYHYYTKHSF